MRKEVCCHLKKEKAVTNETFISCSGLGTIWDSYKDTKMAADRLMCRGIHPDEGLQSETSVFLIFFLNALRCKI